jgi:hypothetical protein
MKTDKRILKIMARMPTQGHQRFHTSSCGRSKGFHECTCNAPPKLIFTLEEVEKAMVKFQQELVFNMPDPRNYETRSNALHAINLHLLGDSGLEIRYAEAT